MALTDENNGIGATMLVSPTGGNFGGYTMPMMPFMPYGQQNGGMFGGNDSWLGILFLIALCNGGFGGGFGGFGNNQLGYDFPWILNGQNDINNNVSDGFRDAQLHDSVTSIRDGISNLSTQLCGCCSDMQMSLLNGFGGVNNSISGAQNAIAQQLYTNQIADLERSYAAQTASTQATNALQSQLAQCCCDNRLGTESLRATVLQENCFDRYEAQNNTRDVIQAITAGVQSIKDDLCAERLDAERRENQNLRTQLNMATLAASQTAQTADLRASQIAANNNLLTELRNCPIPAQAVYGNQPVFTCPQNNNGGCGCGCGSF